MSPIHFNSERERKAYQDGLAIVRQKLASAPRRPTAEMIHQKSLVEGLTAVAVVKQLSALVKAGVPPVPAATAKPITSTASMRKAYTSPAAPRQLTRHCYTTRGIFA